jgi:hypothetical protein
MPDDLASDTSFRPVYKPVRRAEPEIPRISGDEEFHKLKAGSKYIGPDGQTYEKPVMTDADFDSIAEGSEYSDPEGNRYRKPKYEGIGYTAQTLYDMSLTDKERQKALERSYPGKVKKDTEGLYVEDDGTFRRPGRGIEKVTGFLSAATAPTAGAVLGALGGAPGGVAGAAGGGFGGGIAGQYVNDIVLQLAGVYDRTPMEEGGNLVTAGAMGAAGAGVGRGISTVVPSIKAGASAATAALPHMVAGWSGATREGIGMARQLSERTEKPGTGLLGWLRMSETDTLVPPSSVFPEFPRLQHRVEVFDPAFHTQQPLKQSAEAHYAQGATSLLDALGVKDAGSAVKPTAAVPLRQTGEAIKERMLAQSRAADERMQAELARRREAIQAGLPDTTAQRDALRATAEESRKAAQGLIDSGFQHIQSQIDLAMRAAQVGHNSGDLWESVGNQIVAVRQGIMARARTMYQEADELAGGHMPATEGLPDLARQFMEQLPEPFKASYPALIRRLEELGGPEAVTDASGKVVKEATPPIQPTWGQLHDLRSEFRGKVNWYDLGGDRGQGAYKFFSGAIDRMLRDADSVPELRPAVEQLNRADRFYRESMGPLNEKNVQAVVSGLESGLMPDPQALSKLLLRENRTDLARWVKDHIGPNLWNAVRAADLQEMMDASKGLYPGEIDGRAFVRQVLDRQRNGILDLIHDREVSGQLLKQAQSIEALAGRGRLDIPVRPDDNMSTVIARARAAQEAIQKLKATDPVKLLNGEMKRITGQLTAAQKAERQADPLGFLHDPTYGASEAVEKILGSEDLIITVAARLGENSPEFNMLRQVWAQKLLQGTTQPSKRLAGISAEIQQLMFPGATVKQAQTLAKEMDFLMGSRGANRGAGSSMSAFAKVENPWSNIVGRGGKVAQFVTAPAEKFPGFAAGGASLLGGYYKLMRRFSTSPSLFRWVEKGLAGTPEERKVIKGYIDKVLQRGSAVGAGVGESVEQNGMPQ